MKHTLLIAACLLGFTGFSGIVPSQSSAQTLETSSGVVVTNANAVSRNTHSLNVLSAPAYDDKIALDAVPGVAPKASPRPKMRRFEIVENTLSHRVKRVPRISTKLGADIEPRSVQSTPRSVFVPAPRVLSVRPVAPKPTSRTANTDFLGHGAFR